MEVCVARFGTTATTEDIPASPTPIDVVELRSTSFTNLDLPFDSELIHTLSSTSSRDTFIYLPCQGGYGADTLDSVVIVHADGSAENTAQAPPTIYDGGVPSDHATLLPISSHSGIYARLRYVARRQSSNIVDWPFCIIDAKSGSADPADCSPSGKGGSEEARTSQTSAVTMEQISGKFSLLNSAEMDALQLCPTSGVILYEDPLKHGEVVRNILYFD